MLFPPHDCPLNAALIWLRPNAEGSRWVSGFPPKPSYRSPDFADFAEIRGGAAKNPDQSSAICMFAPHGVARVSNFAQ